MKKTSETGAYVKKLIADMNHVGPPLCFIVDNGGEFCSHSYNEFCDPAGIRRGHTAPVKLKQNAVVESAVWLAMKGGFTARRENSATFHERRPWPNPEPQRQR